jgi:hypothetical protein
LMSWGLFMFERRNKWNWKVRPSGCPSKAHQRLSSLSYAHPAAALTDDRTVHNDADGHAVG